MKNITENIICTFEDHFNDDNTIIIGDVVINGYVMFHINDINQKYVEDRFGVKLTDEFKQDVINAHSELTINESQLRLVQEIGNDIVEEYNDNYSADHALILQNAFLDEYVHSNNMGIRCAVAEQGYKLNILINDSDSCVKRIATEQLNK